MARAFGPAVAGLFLAFPAILPASLTLVKEHGGRSEVVDDARGAMLGTLGLIAFALAVVATAAALPAALVLVLATVVWIAVDVGLWFLRFG